ncbi:MAG: serine--tRNA ligase, partial [Armatimonadota bacterium]
MLDLKFILENVEAVKENCRNRRMDADVDRVVRLAGERKRLIADFESIRRQQKDVSQRTRSAPPEEREALVAEGRRLKARLVECEQERDAVERALREEQARIPNMSHPDAPIGAGEEDSVEVRRSGEPTRFDFEPKDHVQIGEALDVIDFEGGSKVAGRNWYFLKNDAVLLEFALVDFALRTL